MNLAYLETLVALAEHKSFSRAAAALNLTQPAVSKHIAYLEAYYGTRLVDRSSRRVELTQAGAVLYRYAREILDALARARNDVDACALTVRGRLLIGASTIPGHYLVPRLIGAFNRLYPEVAIAVEIADTGKVLRMLLEEKVQVGAVGALTNDPRLHFVPFAEDEIVLVVPRRHPLAARRSVSPRAVLGETLVWREEQSGTRRVVEDALLAAGIRSGDLKIAAELGSTEAVLGAVAAGMGLSFISRVAAEAAAHAGSVALVRLQGPHFTRRLYLAHLRARPLSRAAAAFIDFATRNVPREKAKN
ncbi:MAG: selenium metabolism-associated LysR family transcriptional regulator [Bacillota bacterium]